MTSQAIGKADPVRRRQGGRAARRVALLLLGPLAILVVSAYLYLQGGRFASTDDAYVHADNTMISTDVPGRVVEVAVRENDQVKAGQILFKLGDAPDLCAEAGRSQGGTGYARLQQPRVRAAEAARRARQCLAAGL